jgi:alkylation response protein AidB-like acyl-CoA dehydrogenase
MTENIENGGLLTASDKATIKQYAALSEEAGQLHPELLELVYRNNWFKLFVPEIYGGPALLLPQILRLEEELAAADGSLGWTVTLCSGAGWFAGFLDAELATDVFKNRKVCFAGSGAVGGTAQQMENGFRINGSWKYASGASHATIFTANCTMLDAEGRELMDIQGLPLVRSFILLQDEVKILPGWSYFGLVATGSHAFEVNNVLVPLNRSFEINKSIQVQTEGFDYPFLQLAETTLAVNSAGMAAHFIDSIADTFACRSGQKRYTPDQVSYFYQELAKCKAELEQSRIHFFDRFDRSWKELTGNGVISKLTLEEVSKCSRKLAHTSRRVCDELFPYAGLEAARKETELNRIWRDIHTASQHALLTFQ